jgi:hypothetical protein
MESLPYVFDLAGTFVFALSGAMAGVKRGWICLVFWCCPLRQRTRAESPGIF